LSFLLLKATYIPLQMKSLQRPLMLFTWLVASLVCGFVSERAQSQCSRFLTSSLITKMADEGKNDDAFLFGQCSRIEVCTTEKYCKRKGSAKTWSLFQKYAPLSNVKVEQLDEECFMECQTGPNIRLDGNDGRIHGGVQGDEMVIKILGLNPEEVMAE